MNWSRTLRLWAKAAEMTHLIDSQRGTLPMFSQLEWLVIGCTSKWEVGIWIHPHSPVHRGFNCSVFVRVEKSRPRGEVQPRIKKYRTVETNNKKKTDAAHENTFTRSHRMHTITHRCTLLSALSHHPRLVEKLSSGITGPVGEEKSTF